MCEYYLLRLKYFWFFFLSKKIWVKLNDSKIIDIKLENN